MKLSKISSYILYVFLGLSALMGILFYAGAVSEEPMLYLAYIFFGIATIAAIGFPIVYLIMNPKGAKNVIIGLVFIGIIVLISYFLSSDQVMHITGYSGADNVPSTLKTVGTGLYTTYILFFLSILAILSSEIYSAFK